MLLQFSNQPAIIGNPKNVFISYAHKDSDVFEMLTQALFPLKKELLINEWHDRMIKPGDIWADEICSNIESADIILFLISNAFLASDYCNNIEVSHAIERHKNKQAKIIPVIVEPTQWWEHPLAKIQALPTGAKPIKSFPNILDGINQLVERLRVLLLDNGFKIDDKATGLSEVLCLQVETEAHIDQAEIYQIVERLIDLTKNASLRLIAYKASIKDDGTFCSRVIIQCNAESFATIEKSFTDDTLNGAIGYYVTCVEKTLGSTVQVSSLIYDSEVQPPEDILSTEFEILYPSEAFQSARLNGVVVHPEKSRLNFIFDYGDTNDQTVRQEDAKFCADCVFTTILTEEKDIWVNLSPFESNRMLPEAINNTIMGEFLLQSDILLKQFTGSIIHPDTQTGHQFWKSILEEMNSRQIPLDTNIETFQKVWITPSRAQLYENIGMDSDFINSFTTNNYVQSMLSVGSDLCAITDAHLDVLSEWDFTASIIRQQTEEQAEAGKIYMEQFNEQILPILEREVNFGKHFSRFVSMYHSQIIGTWYKTTYCKNMTSKDLINMFGQYNGLLEGSANFESTGAKIFGNEYYLRRYLKLFSEGISKCVRTFTIGDRKVTRHYFSGSIDFSKYDPA